MPHADVVLQSGTDATAKEAVALCLRLVPGWAALRPEDVTVSVISGGITNSLLKVRDTGSKAVARQPCVLLTCLRSRSLLHNNQLVPPTGKDPVVLRIFGLNTEVIIDRERELKARRRLRFCCPRPL